ncbi:hypothetical protein E2C01_092530 [Portunus trituberculatus]|uniref:Uncharacterized protein n=1 Tax=Portunus trituberculatus TaxID=210409 RepID=A0A5B7JSA6_PORTR|nr:hypothetical protein [Portunus trituberculatus]
MKVLKRTALVVQELRQRFPTGTGMWR